MKSATPATAGQKRPLIYRWLKARRHALNAWGAKYSKIPDEPVLDPAQFDWANEIAEHWTDIRDEALVIYRDLEAVPPLRRISPDHRRIATDDSWRSFFLLGYGHEAPANIARVPRTFELVKRIPKLNSAFFSILAPGARIVRHRGVTKGFFTAHLGLVVPDDGDNCTIQVDGHDLHWQAGQWTMFDDTCEHEVWNNTDQPRIVLLCQVGRPLRWPASWVAGAFMFYIKHSPFVREARKELRSWDEAFRLAEDNERV